MSVHSFPSRLGSHGINKNHDDENVQNGHSMKQPAHIGKVDLKEGVVPITKAATSLASLLKRARANHEHIVLTQKGRTAGVLLDIDEYLRLSQLAEQQLEAQTCQEQEHGTPANIAGTRATATSRNSH
jgi:prevent-host-death family protein